MSTIDFDKAMRDPQRCFQEPANVVKDKTLSKEQKIKILKQWEYDAREQSVAEEENMPSGPDESYMLNRVKQALRELGVEDDEGRCSKQ